MTEHNEWFNEVTSQEYHQFIYGIKQIKPKHLIRVANGDDIEYRLDGKLVAFITKDSLYGIIHCITNEDIVC